VRILGISGSVRTGSYNSAALDVAEGLLPDGVQLDRFTGLADLPVYSEELDVGGRELTVAWLRGAIARADGILVATPEYNASLPGGLKNALDWASRPFPDNSLRNKPVAVIGASTGIFGAIWAQAETRKILKAIGARVLDVELPIREAESRFRDRRLDPEIENQLGELIGALIDAIQAHRHRRRRGADSSGVRRVEGFVGSEPQPGRFS
jgi:chromate reductase